jgi:hypothetical protein
MFLAFVSGCGDDNPVNENNDKEITPADTIKIPGRGFYMGLLPNPADGQPFEDVYQKASEYIEFSPVWGKPTPFYEMAAVFGGSWGMLFIENYIRKNEMFPLIHFSFIGQGFTPVSPPSIKNPSLNNPEWRTAYKDAVINVIKVSKPLFFSIGNEVNRWYQKYGDKADDPNAFRHYVSLYIEIYDTVKKISPATNVFCTFAREIVDEHRVADLSVLSMFPPDKMDYLVFTSYPYAVQGINKPEDIPDNYYTEAANKMPGKPFGFSELGWASSSFFGGEEGQKKFLEFASTKLTRDKGINLKLLAWAWLHDIDDNDNIGLKKRDGTAKKAYDYWKLLSTSSD